MLLRIIFDVVSTSYDSVKLFDKFLKLHIRRDKVRRESISARS